MKATAAFIFHAAPGARLSKETRGALQELALKALRGIENLPRRNGAIVQPMKHHAYPRSARSKFVREEKP